MELLIKIMDTPALISHILKTDFQDELFMNIMSFPWQKTKIKIETSSRICQQAYSAQAGWAVGQGMLLQQQLGWETIWGSCCWPPPPSQLEPHFHHLLREESLMGFRGKYQTKTSDSQTTDHFMPPILFPGCHVNHATMCTDTQEVKVSCTVTEQPTALGNNGKVLKCFHGKNREQLATSVTCCLCLHQK